MNSVLIYGLPILYLCHLRETEQDFPNTIQVHWKFIHLTSRIHWEEIYQLGFILMVSQSFFNTFLYFCTKHLLKESKTLFVPDYLCLNQTYKLSNHQMIYGMTLILFLWKSVFMIRFCLVQFFMLSIFFTLSQSTCSVKQD